jgi:hypothetical protein
LATVYTLLASQVPLPIVPAALLSIAGGAPNVASTVTSLGSGVGSLSTPFNQNAVRIDALGRAGAGAYAIDWDSNPASAVLPGLDLTVSSGLTLAIAAGQAIIDSVVQKLAATTLVLTDNIARSYIWMNQAGVISAVLNSLTPVAGAAVFLGSVVTSGGAITAIDGSGVCYNRCGVVTRQTADLGCPSDTPPAGLCFVNHCPGGAFMWTGAGYQNLTDSGRAALAYASDANKTLTAPEYSNHLLDIGAGFTLTAQRNLVVPLTPAGRRWTVRNASTGGQAVQVIGATGTGIVIATTKYAVVESDGTNIIRITPDT